MKNLHENEIRNEIRHEHEKEKKVPFAIRSAGHLYAIEALAMVFGIAAITILATKCSPDSSRKVCQRIQNGENLGYSLTGWLNRKGITYDTFDTLQQFCKQRGIDITQANTLQALRTTLENGGNVPSQLLWDLDAIKSPAEISQSEISSPPAEALEN